MPNDAKSIAMPVLALELDREGRLSRKIMDLRREAQLTNSLLQALYPGIHVATVDVPQEPLDGCQQATVEQALTRLEIEGTRYSLIGASGSAKKGKFYAIQSVYEKKVAERFRLSPQAAMTYFGILVSSCKVLIEEPDCRVLVVDDHELGTNDCRGWLSESLFRKLQRKHRTDLLTRETQRLQTKRKETLLSDQKAAPLDEEEESELRKEAEQRIQGRVLPAHRFYQFRLAFEKTQAKGSFKVMGDDVAQKLEADIILPKSSVKPEYRGTAVRSLMAAIGDRRAHSYRGPVALGIRDVSRNLEFASSYTLVEHAPADSMELEIKPSALREIDKVRRAWEDNDFTELFRLLGIEDTQHVLETGEEPDPAFTSSEYTVAAGALIADGTGYMLKHPFINHYLQKVLTRWAYKVSTSGGFHLPGFTLADDGYLLLHDGFVFAGSDWIPANRAFVPVASRRGLVVRYPIRMKEDLLPFENLSAEEVAALLAEHLRRGGCTATDERVAAVVRSQLQLKGTLTLHSATAATNGGDFDFDQVCVVEGDRFPRFVENRFAYDEQHTSQKTKLAKRNSPWWNLPQVAMQARGNQIGSITDLKTSCLAKGRIDLAKMLVDQLQNALDQLKWGTEPDQELIRNIRKDVGKAPWLKLKDKARISDLDEHLPVEETDQVGKLYNFVRKELGRFFDETAVAPLSDFRGLIGGESFTSEIYFECGVVSRFYGSCISRILNRRQHFLEALEKAEAEVEEKKDNPETRKEAFFRRSQAAAAFHANEKHTSEDLRKLIDMVRMWGQSKNGTRMAYLSALHAIVCREKRTSPDQTGTKGTGSVVFYAFPQEIVDQIAERTGSRPVAVEIPDLADGEVEIDQEGRIFLVKTRDMGGGQLLDTLVFQAQVTKDGEVFTERDAQGNPAVVERVRPFPIAAGRSEARNGKVVFPGTMRRPQVPAVRTEIADEQLH
jgi:hypothetical protein